MHKAIVAPREVQSQQPRIILTAWEEVLIEQHTGLFSYETKCIRIRTRAGLVTVMGENLSIDFFGVQDVLIRGTIHHIGLDGQGG